MIVCVCVCVCVYVCVRARARVCVCVCVYVCVTQTCPERYFDCKDGNTTCVHFLKKCDCVSDCDDASDEDPEYAGCISDATICHNSACKCRPPPPSSPLWT